jgi:hypothetical protein
MQVLPEEAQNRGGIGTGFGSPKTAIFRFGGERSEDDRFCDALNVACRLSTSSFEF